ncbi:MAG: thioredoxin [Sedimentisphaerales bacterium]|nr:thioredoxin [Sedimentisphaerales bacterium]
MTRQINETEFQNEVLNGGKVALVDFYADWCGPCRALAPTIASLAASYGDRALIAKIDVDKHPDLAGQYRIQGIPAVLVFKNGQVVNRLIGLQDRRQYEQALEEALKDTAQLPTGS